jgi:RNA polymerase sigma factor (TIGR02999 family)
MTLEDRTDRKDRTPNAPNDPGDGGDGGDGRDRSDFDRNFAAVYEDVRSIARAYFRRERPGHTLCPTALANEVYYRFQARENSPTMTRSEILAHASEELMRILIDHHRKKSTLKRGRGWRRTTLRTDVEGRGIRVIDFVALEAALDALERETDGPRMRRGAILRWMAGLQVEEVAEVLGLSRASVYEDWTYTRAFLGAHLMEDPPLRSRRLPRPRK